MPLVITPLGYALLGEIRRSPRSRNALRLIFETTPLSIFSSSPGSIYPALKKLEKLALVVAVAAGRGRRFEITPRGIETLEAWLASPITQADVAGRIELGLLRFAFLQQHRNPAVAIRFLSSLAEAASTREAELCAFLEGEDGKALPLHGRLAVEHGIRSIEATGLWAIDAREQLTGDSRGGHS